MALSILIIVAAATFILVRIGLELRDVALSVIALSALGVSIWQGSVVHKHARLSSKPFLDFSWNAHEPNALVLYNGGFGPAIVTQVYIAVGDRPLEPATSSLWAEAEEELGFGAFDKRSFVGDTVIPASSGISVIKNLYAEYYTIVERDAEDSCQKKLRMKVAYKSALEESFETPTVALGQQPPKNPDACPCEDSG